MEILRKYNTATHIYIPIVKRAVVDFAVGADWTPAAGDVKISKDGGAAANVTNLPTAIAMGNTAYWDFSMTATEMQAAKIVVTVADSATKAVEDQSFLIATYGNASAEHAVDLDDAVRAGLTALPNAAAEAAGGLYTRGSGAGQINQPANGMVDVNAVRHLGTAYATPTVAGVPEVDLTHINGDATSLADFKDFVDSGYDPLTNKVEGVKLADTVTTYTGNTPQTGDAFARLGAPAGASVSADIAAIEAQTDDIGVAGAGLTAITGKTDNLPVDPADESLIIAATDAIMTRIGVAGAGLTALGDARLANLDAAVTTRAVAGDAMALTVAERAATADKLLGRTRAGGADGGRTVAECLAFGRNKWEISGGVLTVYGDDDLTPLYTAAVTTAAGDPVTSVDPV